MKNQTRFLGLFAVATLLLAACGSSTTQATTLETGVTLTVWDYFPPAPSPERDAMVKAANDWAAKTGNKVVDPGQVQDAVTKFKVAAPAGNGPDIIMQPQDQEGGLVAAGLLAAPPAGIATADVRAKYAPVALQAETLNGTLYGLPLARESYFLFYNKDLVPTPPSNWQDFITTAKSLTKGDQYGFLWDTTNFYYDYAFIAGEGGYLFKLTSTGYDSSNMGLTTPGGIAGFKVIQDLTQKDKIVPPSTTTDIMEGKFNTGKAGMIIDGPWAVAGFKAKNVNFGVAPLPSLPDGNAMKPFVGIQGMYVSSKSKHSALAWDLVKYLSLNLEGGLYDASGRIPVLTDLSNSSKIKSDQVAQAVITSTNKGVPMPNVPAMSTVWTPMAAELGLLVNGKATPEEVAAGAQAKIQQAIQAMGG